MYYFFLFTVLTLSGIFGNKFQTNCPPAENIKPCECLEIKGRYPSIHCNKLKGIDDLKSAIKNGMSGSKFSDITVHECNIGVLPSEIFIGVDVESITIIYSNVTMLGDGVYRPPFLGLENSLTYLEITGAFQNELVPLKSLSLSHLKKLNILVLNNNIISQINNAWFESGPYDLKELHITNSSIEILGSHAFSSLTELKKISLSGGKLNTITRDMFPNPALHLESIDLGLNALSTLPTNIFGKMPVLEDVYLNGNAFLTIDEAMWSIVWGQIFHLDLLDNPLKCDENIKWIYKSRLPATFEGTCAEPPIMKGNKLKNLKIDDFQ